MTPELNDLRLAAERLANCPRGRVAMEGLVAFLDGPGLGLDDMNQRALLCLLLATWGPYTGTTRALMHEHLSRPPEPMAAPLMTPGPAG